MLSDFAKRHSRRHFVLEFNPYQILAVEVSHQPRGAVLLDAVGEFDRDDSAGLSRWLGARPWAPVICGLVPKRGIIQRESVHPSRLSAPGYLSDVVEEQQKGRFLSATPFKVLNPDLWTLRAVNPVDGTPIPASGPAQPALICGIANAEVQEVQQRLLDDRLEPERIESGLLSLFGAIYSGMERRGDLRAVAIIVIHQVATTVYILGKEGIHTPNPLFHGFNSIMEAAGKELGLTDETAIRNHLHNANPLLLKHADRLLRRIGRDLKPVVDSYEMTTGQPVDEIFCAYLPPKLAWITQPLALVTGRTPMVADLTEWMPSDGVKISDHGPRFGPHWLGALSLITTLAEVAGAKSERPGADAQFHHRPWHVDYRLTTISAERKAAGRRMVTGVLAIALAAFAIAVTGWQLYARHSLTTDLGFWERQIAENRKLFDDLTAANAKLQAQSGILKRAHDLMGTPFQPSNFIIDLGRTIPAHMRVDRIEINDSRAAIVGALLEPAEEATATLGRYIEGLRRNPSIGPFFSNIVITSLQRKTTGDAVLFEITLRLNPTQP